MERLPRRPALAVLALLLALGLAPALAVPAAADRVSDARADARAAALRVEATSRRVQRRAEAVARAARALRSSFAASTDAERARSGAQDALAAARTRQHGQVRRLYAGGGLAGLAASVLGAGSVDDALWRASTADRVLDSVLTAQRRRHEAGELEVSALARAQRAAEAVDQRAARALGVVQDRARRAGLALGAAQAELDRLDERARRLRAAQVAARRLAAARAALAAAQPGGAVTMSEEYRRAYRAAAGTCPGMAWTLLAAVGQVESGHGRNPGPSSAGAIGPMQFMPATFAAYGVDGDGDGVRDAWDPQDAIFSAANYLCASGAGSGADGVHRALLAYNHAEWYVRLVLDAEVGIVGRESTG